MKISSFRFLASTIILCLALQTGCEMIQEEDSNIEDASSSLNELDIIKSEQINSIVNYYRIKNKVTGKYLNLENKYGWVELTQVQPYWYSALWSVEHRGGYFRFINRYTGKYLHTQSNNDYVEAGSLGNNGWWSCDWDCIPLPNGSYQMQNRWTYKYMHAINSYDWAPVSDYYTDSDWASAEWIFESSKPDLIITDLSVINFTDSYIKYSFTVKNQGTEPVYLKMIYVDATLLLHGYYNPIHPYRRPAGGTSLASSASTGTLNPNKSYTLTFHNGPMDSGTIQVVPSRQQFLELKVRTYPKIPEYDENNNTAKVVIK